MHCIWFLNTGFISSPQTNWTEDNLQIFCLKWQIGANEQISFNEGKRHSVTIFVSNVFLQTPNICLQNPNICLQNPNICLQNPNICALLTICRRRKLISAPPRPEYDATPIKLQINNMSVSKTYWHPYWVSKDEIVELEDIKLSEDIIFCQTLRGVSACIRLMDQLNTHTRPLTKNV